MSQFARRVPACCVHASDQRNTLPFSSVLFQRVPTPLLHTNITSCTTSGSYVLQNDLVPVKNIISFVPCVPGKRTANMHTPLYNSSCLSKKIKRIHKTVLSKDPVQWIPMTYLAVFSPVDGGFVLSTIRPHSFSEHGRNFYLTKYSKRVFLSVSRVSSILNRRTIFQTHLKLKIHVTLSTSTCPRL